MTEKKSDPQATELSDEDLDQVAGGATWGQGSVTQTQTFGKEDVLIQNIGFPDDQGTGKFGPSGLGFDEVIDPIKK